MREENKIEVSFFRQSTELGIYKDALLPPPGIF